MYIIPNPIPVMQHWMQPEGGQDPAQCGQNCLDPTSLSAANPLDHQLGRDGSDCQEAHLKAANKCHWWVIRNQCLDNEGDKHVIVVENTVDSYAKLEPHQTHPGSELQRGMVDCPVTCMAKP